jgi:hypothetical protein
MEVLFKDRLFIHDITLDGLSDLREKSVREKIPLSCDLIFFVYALKIFYLRDRQSFDVGL